MAFTKSQNNLFYFSLYFNGANKDVDKKPKYKKSQTEIAPKKSTSNPQISRKSWSKPSTSNGRQNSAPKPIVKIRSRKLDYSDDFDNLTDSISTISGASLKSLETASEISTDEEFKKSTEKSRSKSCMSLRSTNHIKIILKSNFLQSYTRMGLNEIKLFSRGEEIVLNPTDIILQKAWHIRGDIKNLLNNKKASNLEHEVISFLPIKADKYPEIILKVPSHTTIDTLVLWNYTKVSYKQKKKNQFLYNP